MVRTSALRRSGARYAAAPRQPLSARFAEALALQRYLDNAAAPVTAPGQRFWHVHQKGSSVARWHPPECFGCQTHQKAHLHAAACSSSRRSQVLRRDSTTQAASPLASSLRVYMYTADASWRAATCGRGVEQHRWLPAQLDQRVARKRAQQTAPRSLSSGASLPAPSSSAQHPPRPPPCGPAPSAARS